MEKQKVIRDDGRYVLLYTFDEKHQAHSCGCGCGSKADTPKADAKCDCKSVAGGK